MIHFLAKGMEAYIFQAVPLRGRVLKLKASFPPRFNEISWTGLPLGLPLEKTFGSRKEQKWI